MKIKIVENFLLKYLEMSKIRVYYQTIYACVYVCVCAFYPLIPYEKCAYLLI